MILGIFDIVLLCGLLLALLIVAWYVVKKFWPSASTSQTGQVIETVTDATQDVAAKAALRAIRWMDEVDGNPQAVEAWTILYAAVCRTPTKQPSAITTAVTPAATAQTTTAEQTGGVESVDFQ